MFWCGPSLRAGMEAARAVPAGGQLVEMAGSAALDTVPLWAALALAWKSGVAITNKPTRQIARRGIRMREKREVYISLSFRTHVPPERNAQVIQADANHRNAAIVTFCARKE